MQRKTNTRRSTSLSRGPLLWSGEHWILYLRPPGAEADSGQLSLYCAAYSPVGQGTVAYIDIPCSAGLTAVCTDNPDLVDFIFDTMIRGSNNPFDRDLPQWRATFSRAGHIDRNPSWTIQSKHHTLTATWEQLESPLVGPPTINPHIVFTLQIYAAAGQMQLNGVAVPGSPYPRDAWSKSLGQARSSCCFALAETMIASSE
ncbi:MAG: hypothetical protein F4Z30_11555 [Gemmatimonadetes bacterium]|nr:hypothetical protein [Gemmatimonadota bacterium]